MGKEVLNLNDSNSNNDFGQDNELNYLSFLYIFTKVPFFLLKKKRGFVQYKTTFSIFYGRRYLILLTNRNFFFLCAIEIKNGNRASMGRVFFFFHPILARTHGYPSHHTQIFYMYNLLKVYFVHVKLKIIKH